MNSQSSFRLPNSDYPLQALLKGQTVHQFAENYVSDRKPNKKSKPIIGISNPNSIKSIRSLKSITNESQAERIKSPSLFTSFSKQLFKEGSNQKDKENYSMLSPEKISKYNQKNKAEKFQDQQIVVQRLFGEFQKQQEKKNELVERIEMEKNLISPKVRTAKIDFQEFYNKQIDFNKRSQDKKMHISLEMEEKLKREMRKPEISNNSLKLAQKHLAQRNLSFEVFQRLYSQSRKQSLHFNLNDDNQDFLSDREAQLKKQALETSKEPLFSPKINIRSKKIFRSLKVDEILYSDAKRRINSQKLSQNNNNKNINPKASERSCIILTQRTLKELQMIINEEGLQDNSILSTVQSEKIITRMGLLNCPNPHKSIILEFLIENQEITIQRLAMFILTVLGLSTNGLHKSQISEWKKVASDFRLFQLSRKSLKNYNKTSNSLNFKPQVCNLSNFFAKEFRNKLLQKLLERQTPLTNLKLEDLLIYSKEETKNNIINKRQEQITKELSQCTFSPNTIDYKSNRNSYSKRNTTPTNRIGIARFETLFELAKPKKHDRDKEEVNFEKNCDECTFEPSISKKKNSVSCTSVNCITERKDCKKTVDRLTNARVDKKVKNKLIGQGFTFTENKEKLLKIKEKERENEEFSKMRKDKREKSESKKEEKEKTESFFETSNSRLDKLEERKSETLEIEESDKIIEKNINSGMKIFQLKEAGQLEERIPLLFVDVNIAEGKTVRIVIYDKDKSDELARKFCEEYGLDDNTRKKLKEMLEGQINGLLSKIDEETCTEDSKLE